MALGRDAVTFAVEAGSVGSMFKITFDGFPPESWNHRPESCSAIFSVHTLERRDRFVIVYKLDETYLNRALRAAAPEATPIGEEKRLLARRTLARFALRALEGGLREGGWSEEIPFPDGVLVEEADLPALTALFADKNCDYKVKEGGELFCAAASSNDDTATAEIGNRRVAPTARTVCNGCDLPSSDEVCSHLKHPAVQGIYASGGFVRQLESSLCDVTGNRPGPMCVPGGGLPCWERLVELSVDQPAARHSPRLLPDALDYLDAVWRLAFKGKRLVRLRRAEDVAALVDACLTRKDFVASLSALDDIIKAMLVDDAILDPAVLDDENIKGDKTLNRLKAALEHNISDAGAKEQGLRAVVTLRNVNIVRVALQHSGRANELYGALAALGIASPPDWGPAWDRVRSNAVEALSELRKAIQTVADVA